eukprot:CCRYP_014492-RA/>CCRYP_014492-RA protein AED:0.48 eAED:0.42 QI:0/-1/0/1/-1/1/1/0/588
MLNPCASVAPCQSQLVHLSLDRSPSAIATHPPVVLPTVTPLVHKPNPPSPPKFKLTLSAYRRTENTVRLTDASPAKLIHSEYELLDPSSCHTLGHGASSTVRLAYHRRTGRAVAVKTIAKHDALGLFSKNRWRDGGGASTRKRIPRLEEVDVLTALRGCPDVIQLLDVYESNTEVQLVLEYCEGGDLFDCIKSRRQRRLLGSAGFHGDFLECEASRVAKTLLGVLENLHFRHIVHRDVKPENILLVKPDEEVSLLDVKLTDFGLAKILRHDSEEESSSDAPESNVSSDQESPNERKQRSRAYSRVGSDYYTAPEVHSGLGYDTPVDIYSLGVTIYVMLCGVPPSTSQFTQSLYKMQDENATPSGSTSDGESSSSDSEESAPCTPTSKADLFPSELNVSPLAQDFVCNLIHPDPARRITASNALKHKWITQYAIDSGDARTMVHDDVSAALSTSKTGRSRTLSVEEAEALLRLPIQGSLYEIAPPVIPPTNSPKASSVPTPPPVSVTLASVCSKLVPLVDEQRHHKHRRLKSSSKKHSRGAEDKASFVSSLSTPPKKVCMEQQPASSNTHKSVGGNASSCNRFRIAGHS